MAPRTWRTGSWGIAALGISLWSQPVHSDPFVFRPSHNGCGVCQDILDGTPCELFGACHVINSSAVRHGCSSFCGGTSAPTPPPASADLPDVRVVKGFGAKGYDQIRISVVSEDAEGPNPEFFDYSRQFQYKWTENFLHSAMKSARPGAVTTFPLGPGLEVKLPRQGEGTAGVLIADPCLKAGSIMGSIFCHYGNTYKTYVRTAEILNTFVPDRSTDYWGILGDNFYDRVGSITKVFFRQLSWQVKSKLFVTVPGNHDYWVMGHPVVATRADQCGNGFMQFYAQDAKSAEGVLNGSAASPFDFSVDPEKGRLVGCNLPALSNVFWYNQIGNVGLVGQSAGHSLQDAWSFMEEACKWLAAQDGLEVAVLFGHWDILTTGAKESMEMPAWYHEMAQLPGCRAFHERGTLKYVMGHTHCNSPHPRGDVGAGFRVGGFGMETSAGCSNYGVPILDTTESQIRFWYFDTSTDERYESVMACVKNKGSWRQCLDLAEVWHAQDLPPSKAVDVLI